MAKKGTVGTSMIPTPEKGVADLGSMPTLDDILKDPGLSMAQKRHKALIFEGYKVPRQRYGSKEEKKTAAKKRRDTAKDTRLAFYKKLGIEPKAKVRLSKEERKERSKARSKTKRSSVAELIRLHPEAAKSLGIKVRYPKK